METKDQKTEYVSARTTTLRLELIMTLNVTTLESTQ